MAHSISIGKSDDCYLPFSCLGVRLSLTRVSNSELIQSVVTQRMVLCRLACHLHCFFWTNTSNSELALTGSFPNCASRITWEPQQVSGWSVDTFLCWILWSLLTF